MARAPRRIPDDIENTADDGYPLGLPCPPSLLDAATVEAVGRRHNVWTRAKMRVFLDALVRTASVKDAAALAGMSRQSAYRLRARLAGQPFDLAWEAALEFGLQQLAHVALERALHGVEEPVFHAGEQVGTRTRYDERLTIFLLANPGRIGRHPERRERMLDMWAQLLDAVEHAPPDWDGIEALAGSANDDPDEKARLDRNEKDFLAHRSHYAARAPAAAPSPFRPSWHNPGRG